jgi:hypothetical protein
MFFVIPSNKIDYKSIFYGEKVDNIILKDSLFVKLFYSTNNIILNGIYISADLSMNYRSMETHSKVSFERNNYFFYVIEKLNDIENTILNNFCKWNHEVINKNKNVKIKQQLSRPYIKIPYNLNKDYTQILIKISGIWITETEYGITYKFIPIVKQSFE